MTTSPIRVAEDVPVPIGFSGRLSGFVGLAIGNLLLTIITIGIYRFWAKTKVRRHLWQRTSFRGEPLEYTGRGIEKFLGALIVFAVVILPLVVVSMVAGVLAAGQHYGWVGLLYLIVYLGMFYLLGVGLYRSQRYMFSRTAWRGIRGGMKHGGWAYGWLYLKMLLLSLVTLGFASPYTSTRLWNARMNDAMFGSAAVHASAEWRPLYRSYLIAWIPGLLIYIGMIVAIVSIFGPELAAFKPGAPPPENTKALTAALFKVYAIAFVAGIGIALLMLRYHAALLRELFGKTGVGTLGLHFDATAGDLLRYLLGNVALVVLTLGLGIIMMPFRVWSFYVRHLATVGDINIDALQQTSLDAPIQGDGLADAFDAAAF